MRSLLPSLSLFLPSLSLTFSLALSLYRSHFPCHTLLLTLLPLRLYLSNSHSLSNSHFFPLSLSDSRNLLLAHSLTVSETLSLKLSLTDCLSHSHCRCYTLHLPLYLSHPPISPSHSPSRTLPLTHSLPQIFHLTLSISHSTSHTIPLSHIPLTNL